MMKYRSCSLLMNSLILCVVLLFTITTTHAFNCTSPSSSPTAKCNSLIDYIPPNTTTLSHIKTLFGVPNLHTLLGANSMPVSTPPTQSVPANRSIKIPFECLCANGTGVSNRRPIYRVKAGDGLDHIARDVFGALVTYQQIQAVNGIANASLIMVGQELWIPLPCSCDKVDGSQVVHYGHVVAPKSTLQQIADAYGSRVETLLRLNGLADPRDLLAGAVLDVPLRACASSISNQSRDSPLRLSNGTYAFTAHNCVQCKCDASNNYILQCDPSPPKTKLSDWSKCPSMICEGLGNSSIGDSMSSGNCQNTTCSYAGYNHTSILTTLTNISTCNPEGAPQSPPRSHAMTIGLSGNYFGRASLFVSLALLSLSHLL
ncbi:hypothetical protein Sjap_009759 [Stephania japonica]|uniref:LysM domain-containing protein n=1 Tax=Stephania japonica TaxID=461633 RepID=A0AAP0JAF6_9MAGN